MSDLIPKRGIFEYLYQQRVQNPVQEVYMFYTFLLFLRGAGNHGQEDAPL